MRMLLGDFDYPSLRRENRVLAGLFFWSFSVLCLFLLLNFIIAIIVEAYMKVVTAVAMMEADQEFVSDVTSVTFVSVKSLVLRWPGHMQLINELKNSCYSTTISHCVMRRLFPKFRMKGITSFLHHYKRYDFMSTKYAGDPVNLNEEQELAVKTTVSEIEERLCAMMGVPIPSPGELIMENKRLSMIGDVERVRRLGDRAKATGKGKKKNKTRKEPVIGPSLVARNVDNGGMAGPGDGTSSNALEQRLQAIEQGIASIKAALIEDSEASAKMPSRTHAVPGTPKVSASPHTAASTPFEPGTIFPNLVFWNQAGSPEPA